MLSGVPQGNTLGPLLFAIIINDLPQSLNSATPFRFADDTKCVHSVKSFNDITKLQIDINATYPLGASPQIFCSTNLNLFIFISGKNRLQMSLHILPTINQLLSRYSTKIRA